MIIMKTMTLKLFVSCLMLLHDSQSSKLGTSMFTDRALKTRGGYFEYTGSSQDTKVPFQTWTFDSLCSTMSWNELPKTKWSVQVPDIDEVSNFIEDKIDEVIFIGVAPTVNDTNNDLEDCDQKNDPDEPLSFDMPELSPMTQQINEGLNGILNKILEDNYDSFKNGANIGSATPTVHISQTAEDGSVTIKKIVLLGLGKSSDGNETMKDFGEFGRKVGTAIAQKCISEKGATSCTVFIPKKYMNEKSTSELSASFMASLYSDNRYKSEKKKKINCEKLGKLNIVIDNSFEGSISELETGETLEDDEEVLDSALLQIELEDAIEKGIALAKGIYLAKDIVNSPHNVCNSKSLANTALEIARESGGKIKCTILEKKDCEKRGMGAFLGVARGSETPPKFIHLSYRPKKTKGKNIRKIGIVGKGLLMDTGGYNIKTRMMELMKFDCGGAAAVLGAARSLALLSPDDVEVHIVVAACENMISDRAFVPGDILTASNGVTIEIGNTDAEGRLTMADALVYLDEEIGCDRILELSTLTGACLVALGNRVAGIWTSDEELAQELEQSSKLTGEKIWRMPLEKEYDELLKSKIADINNLGASPYGGSITAALFLQNFVSKNKPFAHVDMAGPVWNTKSGATGWGSKLVTDWICSQA